MADAPATVIGRVAVKVSPDTSDFRGDAKRDLNAIERDLRRNPVEVPLEVDGDGTISEARRIKAAVKAAIEEGALKIRIDVEDQDEVKRALRLIDAEIDKFKPRVEWSVGLDEKSLREEQARLQQMLADVASIDLRIDDGNVSSLRSQLGRVDAELQKLREVTVDVALNEDSLSAAKQALEEEIHALTNNIDLAFNEDSLDSTRGAIRQVERELARIEQTDLRVDLDRDSLEATRDLLSEIEDAHVRAEIEADNASFAAFRAAVEAVTSDVTIHPNIDPASAALARRRIEELAERLETARLRIVPELSDRDRLAIEREIERITEDLDEALTKARKSPTLSLSVDPNDLRSIDRSIEALRTRIEDRPIEIDLDDDSLRRAMANLERARTIRFITEVDDDNRAFAALRERIDSQLGTITINPAIGQQEVERLRLQLDDLYTEIEKRKLEITPEMPHREKDRLQREINSFEGEVAVLLDEISLRHTQGRLAYLSRGRIAEIVPEVNRAAALRAGATLAALSGSRSIGNIAEDLSQWIGGLDKALPRIAMTTTAVANLAGWLGAASSNALTAGSSLASTAGAALALPGILGGLAIGFGASVAVLKDFNAVLPEVGTNFHELQDAMSGQFWSRAEAPFRDFIDSIFPEFSAGMEATSAGLGEFFADLAHSAKGTLNGELEGMFNDLADSIVIASDHTDAYLGIVEKLGTVGAGNLPRLAGWVGDIADGFDGWLDEKGAVGLQAFVDQGIIALQDLGGLLNATGGTFAALARAAENAGGSTLATMRETMEGVERVVKGSKFQSLAMQTFKAAHDGMEEISKGSGPEFQSFMERLVNTLDDVLPTAGSALGGAVGGILDALDRPDVQRSVTGFFEATDDAVRSLTPTLPAVASGLAEMVDVLSVLASGTASAAAPALKAFGEALEVAGPGAADLAEAGTDLIQNVLEVAGPVFVDLAAAAGTAGTALGMLLTPVNLLIDAVQLLPAPVGDATSALVTAGLLVGGALWFGANVRAKLAAFAIEVNRTAYASAAATRIHGGLAAAAQGIASRMTAANIAAGAGGLALLSWGANAEGAAESAGFFASVAGGALMGLSTGTPWAAAIGAGVGGLVALKNAGFDATDMFVELNNTLGETSTSFEDRFAALDQARQKFDDGWGTSAEEIDSLGGRMDYLADKPLRAVKLGFEQMWNGIANGDPYANSITEGTEQLEEMEDALRAQQTAWFNYSRVVATAAGQIGISLDPAKASIQDVGDVADDISPALEAVGSSISELQQLSSRANLPDDILGLWDLSDRSWEAQRDLKDINDALADYYATANSPSGRNQAVADALRDIGDASGDAKTEVEALERALSGIFDPGMDLRAAVGEYHEALRELTNLSAGAGFDPTTEAGFGNVTLVDTWLAELQELVVAQAEAGASAADLSTTIAEGRAALIEQGVAAGIAEEDIKAYVDQIGLTPEMVATMFTENGLEEIGREVLGLHGDIEALDQVDLRMEKASRDFQNFTRRTKHEAEVAGRATGSNLSNGMGKGFVPGQLSRPVNGLFSGFGPRAFSAGSGAGTNFADGFSGGIRARVQSAISAAASLVSSALAAASSAMRAASPSREMIVRGKWFSEGFAIGIQQRAALAVRAATEMTKHVVHAAQVQMGHTAYLSTQFNKAGDAYEKLLSKFKGSNRGLIGKMFGDDISRLSNSIKNVDKITDALRDATSDLEALNNRVEQFRSNIVDSFVASANPVTSGARTFDGLIRGMQQARDRAVEFQTSLVKLQAAGLDNTTLEQLAAAGPEAALATVRALLEGGEDGLKQVALLQQQMAAAGQSFANSAGNQIYGPALTLAQNQVSTLTGALKNLQQQIASYSNALLQAMSSQLASTTVKTALGNIKGLAELQAALTKAGQAATATKSRISATSTASAASSIAHSQIDNSSSNRTVVLNYYAAPNNSLPEEDLFEAMARVKGI